MGPKETEFLSAEATPSMVTPLILQDLSGLVGAVIVTTIEAWSEG